MREILSDENLNRLMNIGSLLASERNMSKLLDIIVTEAMLVTNCDGGTLYLYEDDMLHFKIMRNHSMNSYQGGEDEMVNLPPVAITEKNVCSYAVIHRKMENIKDVYETPQFDFTGVKKYDEITGYRTQSMLVIPLENNKGEIVGVLQLINALDENNRVIPFHPEYEKIFRSIASQAAIAVTNMGYTKDIKELFNSLVQVLAAAIDERSPYNANHTKNVVTLVTDFLAFINEKHEKGETDLYFDEELQDQIIMAAWLHDIGKIITPLEIMDKATRLGPMAEVVQRRFEILKYAEQTRYLKGEITKEAWNQVDREIMEASALCQRVNERCATSEELALIRGYAERSSIMENGVVLHWLTPAEVECLAIQYGTLTVAERKIMEDHVSITKRLLNKIKFTKEYKDVPLFAENHHERLNGKGYPSGLVAEEIPLAARILTVMDVYEALISKDRPYKKPVTRKMALVILKDMAEKHEVDKGLVMLLEEQIMSTVLK